MLWMTPRGKGVQALHQVCEVSRVSDCLTNDKACSYKLSWTTALYPKRLPVTGVRHLYRPFGLEQVTAGDHQHG